MNQPIVTYKSNLNSIIISNIINENYDVEQYRSDVKKLLSEHENISSVACTDEGDTNLSIELICNIIDILKDYPIKIIFFRSEYHFSDEVDIYNLASLLDKIYQTSKSPNPSLLYKHFKKLALQVYGTTIEYLDDIDDIATAVAKFGLIDPTRIPYIYIGDWRGPGVVQPIINAAINRKIEENNKQNKGNLNTVIYALVNPLTTLNLPGLPEEVWLKIGKEATGIDSRGTFSVNPNTYFRKK